MVEREDRRGGGGHHAEDLIVVEWGRGGPLAACPAWVYRSKIGDKALRLYLVLSGEAGSEARPALSKPALAQLLGCAKSTLERAMGELVKVGALTIVPRWEGRVRLPNGYVIHAVPEPPGGSPDQSGDPALLVGRPRPARRADRAGEETQGPTVKARRVPGTAPRDGGSRGETSTERAVLGRVASDLVALAPKTVDRKTVSEAEAELALAVLAAWNEATGQRLTSKDWVAKIIMRIREHPDLSPADHAAVIRSALARPWWKGTASPSVVYGQGGLFERTLAAAGDTLAELDRLEEYDPWKARREEGDVVEGDAVEVEEEDEG